MLPGGGHLVRRSSTYFLGWTCTKRILHNISERQARIYHVDDLDYLDDRDLSDLSDV